MARPARKKNDIERAALELFAETGIDGTSIRDIATRAGVTEGALYRHHKGKDDLVRALFFQHFDGYAKMLQEASTSAPGIEARLNAMIDGFFKSYDADPRVFWFVMLVQHKLLEDVRGGMPNPIEVVMGVIEDAAARGEIPKQDTTFSAQVVMGIVTQVAVGHRYGRLTGKLRKRAPEVAHCCLAVLRR